MQAQPLVHEERQVSIHDTPRRTKRQQKFLERQLENKADKRKREENIRRAINSVQRGMTQQDAAEKYGLARTTLRGRLNGRQSRQKVSEDRQLLTAMEEKALAEYIVAQEVEGHQIRHGRIRTIALKMLEKRAERDGTKDHVPVSIGHKWLSRFKKRHFKDDESIFINSDEFQAGSTFDREESSEDELSFDDEEDIEENESVQLQAFHNSTNSSPYSQGGQISPTDYTIFPRTNSVDGSPGGPEMSFKFKGVIVPNHECLTENLNVLSSNYKSTSKNRKMIDYVRQVHDSLEKLDAEKRILMLVNEELKDASQNIEREKNELKSSFIASSINDSSILNRQALRSNDYSYTTHTHPVKTEIPDYPGFRSSSIDIGAIPGVYGAHQPVHVPQPYYQYSQVLNSPQQYSYVVPTSSADPQSGGLTYYNENYSSTTWHPTTAPYTDQSEFEQATYNLKTSR